MLVAGIRKEPSTPDNSRKKKVFFAEQEPLEESGDSSDPIILAELSILAWRR